MTATANAGVIPVAGWDRWLEVMERAGYRCQCERPHPKHRGGRCENEQHDGCRLVAGPTDPGPDPARTMATCDPEELIAWCPDCWDRSVRAARKALRDADHLYGVPGQGSLFGDDDGEGA